MSVLQNAKSLAKKVVDRFIPPVISQVDLTTQQGVGIAIQAREGNVVGVRLVIPQVNTTYTAFLTMNEARLVSDYLQESIKQCDQHLKRSEVKQ